MSILSIQSHVAYGYVGNKAAVFPLQSMGYDVWPVNTVQFSNHTGYGKWTGELFSPKHIQDVVQGIEQLGVLPQCQAVLSGYLGNGEIGSVLLELVQHIKTINPYVLHVCDPVIGDVHRGIFVKEEVVNFFLKHLTADIITPNHFEAEILSGQKINTLEDAKTAAEILHERNIQQVLITSLEVITGDPNKIYVFLSDKGQFFLAEAPLYDFPISPNGTGDLFTALFLGNYLKSYNGAQALHECLILMNTVMKNTFEQKSRELKILNIDYRSNVPNSDSVNFISL